MLLNVSDMLVKQVGPWKKYYYWRFMMFHICPVHTPHSILYIASKISMRETSKKENHKVWSFNVKVLKSPEYFLRGKSPKENI